jgi:hypothetical protein
MGMPAMAASGERKKMCFFIFFWVLVHLRVGALPNSLVGAQLRRRAAPWWSTCSGDVFSELEPYQTTHSDVAMQMLSLETNE